MVLYIVNNIAYIILSIYLRIYIYIYRVYGMVYDVALVWQLNRLLVDHRYDDSIC